AVFGVVQRARLRAVPRRAGHRLGPHRDGRCLAGGGGGDRRPSRRRGRWADPAPPGGRRGRPRRRLLSWVSVAGGFAAGVPSILFLVGIRTIGGTRAGILMLFEPVVGVTLAALLLHEGLVPIQVVGGGAILAAAALLQRGAKPGERIEPIGVPSVEHSGSRWSTMGEDRGG